MPPLSSREKEKAAKLQEKYQAILSGLLRDDDNKYCVDCDSKGPRWASWNLGIFLCIRCAGIHRNLGVHISRVKSVNLDQWTAEQIASMQAMGNLKGRQVYECHLPENFRRSPSDSAMEQFIRSKYEMHKWIDKTWSPQKIVVPAELSSLPKTSSTVDSSSTKNNKLGKTGNSSSSSSSRNINSSSKSSSVNKTSSASSKVNNNKPQKPEPVLLDFGGGNNDFMSNNNSSVGKNQNDSNSSTNTNLKQEVDFFSATLEQQPNTSNSTNGQHNLFENLDGLVFENHTQQQQPQSTKTNTESTADNIVNGNSNNNQGARGDDLEAINFNTVINPNGSTALDKSSIMALFNKIPAQPQIQQQQQQQQMTSSVSASSNISQLNGLFGANNSSQQQQQPQQQQQQQSSGKNNLDFQMGQMNLFGQSVPPANTNVAPSGQNSSANTFNMFDDLMSPKQTTANAQKSSQPPSSSSNVDLFANFS